MPVTIKIKEVMSNPILLEFYCMSLISPSSAYLTLHLFISISIPLIYLLISYFISSSQPSSIHLSSSHPLSIHLSLLKKNKVSDEGQDEERDEDMKKKNLVQAYIKPNMVLSQIPFYWAGGGGVCGGVCESLQTYISTTYIHTYTIVTT